MQILIVILLAIIALVMAPWLFGLVVAGAAAYGTWLIIGGVIFALVFAITFAVGMASANKKVTYSNGMTVAEMIENSNRIAREREAREAAERDNPVG